MSYKTLYVIKHKQKTASGDYRVDNGITKIENSKTEFAGGDIVDTADNNTKFVIANYKTDPDDNYRFPDGTVSIYTGISNVPTLESFPNGIFPIAVSYKADGTADNIADIVFIYDDVYAAAGSSYVYNYVYVVGTYYLTSSGYYFDVIVKGESDTIHAKSAADRNILTSWAGKLVDIIKIDSTGSLDVAGSNELDYVNADAKSSIVNNGGLLILDGVNSGYTVEDNTPVYMITRISNHEAIIDVIEAKDLDGEFNAGDFSYVDADNDKHVSAIYIIIDDR